MRLTAISGLSDTYRFGFHAPEEYVYKARKGLSLEIVEEISGQKKEPKWMRDFRLKSLAVFESKSLPRWGADLSEIDFQQIYYYLKPTERMVQSWNDVPEAIKRTYEKLGIPEAERDFLAGVKAQFDSEVVYGSLLKRLSDQGVIFLSMDQGLREHEDLVRQYFGKLIPATDNKFSALNSAVWSGGSFIYVPKGVKVELPLQAYFRINAVNMGQFERTLIIADEGSYVSYVEGCSAPVYSRDALHAAVVEIFVKKGARVRYTTIQNWSNDVYNLVTKRMRVEEEGIGEWIDCNLGSKITMKYPSCYLFGRKAHGEILSMAAAGFGQHLDAGGKMVHLNNETTSKIINKSISRLGGRTSYRGLLKVIKGLKGVKAKVVCDALILDEKSRSDTYPLMQVDSRDVVIEHEATVSKIGARQLFYLMSRGLSEEEASSLILNGFIEPIVKQLPLEYAVETNRLMELNMEGSVG